MPWIFSEETGCFSFCPLTSISFPPLHPLFPSQNPFLQNPPLLKHFLFLWYHITNLLSNHPSVNTAPPPCCHLLPHTYTMHFSFCFSSSSSLFLAVCFFFFACSGPVIIQKANQLCCLSMDGRCFQYGTAE